MKKARLRQSARDELAQALPNAAGDVDLTVTVDGEKIVARSAYTYYDPNATVDPFTFEPILFPIAYNGPGQFGSQWKTENVIAGYPLQLHPPFSCPGCGSYNAQVPLTETSRQGLLLWAVRGSADNLSAGSRISDVSRIADGAGTEVRVVREHDLKDRDLRLLNIPTGGNNRATLRIWSLGESRKAPWLDESFRGVPLGDPVFQDGFTFWSVDITAALARAPSSFPATIRVSNPSIHTNRIWALLSITNNDTQQITLISPVTATVH